MSAPTRLLGSDVQIRIASGGIPQTTITAIKNFTFETRQRILSEGYLGETGLRQDSIYDEVGGSFGVHPETTDILTLQKAIADKAITRRQSGIRISVSFRVQFPNGQSARITIPNMEFDPIPFNVGGRDAYVDMNFSFKAETYILGS